MTEAIPIYTGQDFYIPQYRVTLDGRDLDPQVVQDVLSVSYRDNLTEVDSFELTVNNWDEEFPTFKDARSRTFKYSDPRLFDPGQTVELWMGYLGQGEMHLMLRGDINSLRTTFPASGPSTLAVGGLNLLHRLRNTQVSDRYEGLRDSQIAERIGRRLNVDIVPGSARLPDEKRYPYLFQDNQYDIVFLMERARRIGYELYVLEDAPACRPGRSCLYFGPSTAGEPRTYELVYGESLIEFNPELTTANQVGKVTVRSWDRRRKRAIQASATRSELRTRGVGTRGRQSAIEQSFGDREEVITDQPVDNQEEAKQLALETLEHIAKDMVKGSGSVVGLPDLRAGSVVCIDGLGSRFSGRYFVTATTHSIDDSGYKTQFECRREEKQA